MSDTLTFGGLTPDQAQDQIKRNESFRSTEPLEKPGMYKVKVTDAFDSWKVFGRDKTRSVILDLEIIEPFLTKSESEAEFEDRKSEVGHVARGVRIYVTAGTVKLARQNVFHLLATMSGDLNGAVPEEVVEAARVVKDGVPNYDPSILAEKVPINATALVGRVFVINLELEPANDPKRPDYVKVDIFTPPIYNGEENEDAMPVFSHADDPASDAARERIGASGGGPKYIDTATKSNGSGGGYDFTPDDDLPF